MTSTMGILVRTRLALGIVGHMRPELGVFQTGTLPTIKLTLRLTMDGVVLS
jgi:hypothetical protein